LGVRVAYGKRKNVVSAIESGVIPKDCIIITSDSEDSELLFYDAEGNLKVISERTRFESLEEAEAWVREYPCLGFIVTVRDGARWLPYSVGENGTLLQIPIEGQEMQEITRIDGGSSEGI